LYVPDGLGEQLERKEAITLLKELGKEHLIQPSLVLIRQITLNSYQLEIKGDYDRQLIEIFLKVRGFSYEEKKDYLVIFKP
jgi:hypothetical protein